MGTLRGERFDINLSSEDEHDEEPKIPRDRPEAVSLVQDIQERSISNSQDVRPPALRPHQAGFPAHTKRASQYRAKNQRVAASRHTQDRASLGTSIESIKLGLGSESRRSAADERREIDRENQQKLASMSHEEIALERDELMKGLDSSVLQGLLNRAQIDDGPTDTVDGATGAEEPKTKPTATKPANGTASGDAAVEPQAGLKPAQLDASLVPDENNASRVHFPKPDQPKDLDPSDPLFFDNLHAKYFPSLPSEPSKLSWMRSSSGSNYSPGQESVRIAELRFDFRGALIAPRKASEIPVTAGLHHHGDAPDSAGYTVPELAHLSRSSVPMQRCIAFQTLGRLMYRLGIGEFGEPSGQIPKGLERMLKEGRVLDTLQEAANQDAGHVSARAHATEALWLWRRGGGSSMDAV